MKYQEIWEYFNIVTVRGVENLPAALTLQTYWLPLSSLSGLPVKSMLPDLNPRTQNILQHPFVNTVALPCPGLEKAKKLSSSPQERWIPTQV